MPIIKDAELPIEYVEITGPGVDAFNNRKETGSKRAITDQEIRASYRRVKHKLFAGIKTLVERLPPS